MILKEKHVKLIKQLHSSFPEKNAVKSLLDSENWFEPPFHIFTLSPFKSLWPSYLLKPISKRTHRTIFSEPEKS